MSKKKSLAWGRKTTGHISKGVLNYGNIEAMGRSKGGRGRFFKKLRKRKAIAHALDAERQAQDANLDFNLVKASMDTLGLTLEEAKKVWR